MINYHGMKKTVVVFLFFLIYSIYAEGTLVETINQKIPIENLKQDDLVLTYNFKTSEFEYKKILKIFKKTVDKIIQIEIKNRKKKKRLLKLT